MSLSDFDNHDGIISPLAFTASAPKPDPARLRIYDSTLRDGEQMPGVAMSPEQKYRIAEELSQIGCHIIDVGFPAVSATERQALQLILDGKLRGAIRPELEILVMSRSLPSDIDATIDAIQEIGFTASEITLLIFTSASPLHVRQKLGATLLRQCGIPADEAPNIPFSVLHEANKAMVTEAIRYALDRGVEKVEFGSEDASRTPIPLLLDLIQAAVDAGAARYIFPDTTGSLTPEATRIYAQALSAKFPAIELASHFHNDFSLATANVITGILHGLTTFSTTVNGIGERAGNAPLHSVVASLKYLYGLEIPGFQYDRLCHLKHVVEDISGVPVQAHEPVIGYNAFTHESGIHTHGVSIDRRMYEPIPYEEVGGTPRFVYGKHSGLHCVSKLLAERAREIDLEPCSKLSARVLEEIKATREKMAADGDCAFAVRKHYGSLERLGISEEQVLEIAKSLSEVKAVAASAGDAHGSAK